MLPRVPHDFLLLCSLTPWLVLVMVFCTSAWPGHCSLRFEGKMGLFKALLTSYLSKTADILYLPVDYPG